jgi:hypothetical protein
MLVIVLAVALIGGTWAAGATTIPGIGVCGPYDIATPLTEPAILFGVRGPNGQFPCGLMYICAHGHKVVTLDPDHAERCRSYGTNLTVYCLNGRGEWTAQEVYNVSVWPNASKGEFDVYQHGYCAWFPTGETPVQGGVIE